MPADWSNLLPQLDALLRTGKETTARQLLRKAVLEKIPRRHQLPAARLCRRANLPAISLRILRPLVRPPRSRPMSATPSEIAEYAAALSRIGGGEEALALMATLPAGPLAEANLYRGFAFMSLWRYREAIPEFVAYLEHAEPNAYQRLVAKVNLAACLVFERDHSRAGALLDELRRSTADQGHRLLYGNVLELATQNHIFQGELAQAEHLLDLAETALQEHEGAYALYLRKWRAVGRLMRDGDTAPCRELIAAVRAEAVRLHNWETLRTLDRFVAIRNADPRLFTHVYFGSPYPAFRERLCAELGTAYAPRESYLWKADRKAPGVVFDAFHGLAELPDGKAALKPGLALHRLAELLSRDFYRPVRLAAIHHHLYPGEHFNIESSPDRIHQLMKRLRQWLTRSRVPLRLARIDEAYQLFPTSFAAIRRAAEGAAGDRATLLLERIRQLWPDTPFSSSDVHRSLAVAPRSARRILSDAARNGELTSVGAGRSARYRLRKA